MKKLIYIFLMLAAVACEKNDSIAPVDETAVVTVSASLPRSIATRSEAYTQVVDKVACAVFKDGVEIEQLRRTLDATDETMTYEPRLAIDQTYDVVFFAYKEGAYNVDDLTSIKRMDGVTLDEQYFEVFAACKTINVDGDMNISVTLKRPVAKISIGVTAEDFDAASVLGMTPTSTGITVTGAYSHYNALTGQPTSEEELSFNPVVDCATLTVNGESYRRVGQCFFFTDGGNVDISCDFKANGCSIRGSVLSVPAVPVGPNRLTSLVGNMMTGTLEYTISLSSDYDDDSAESI